MYASTLVANEYAVAETGPVWVRGHAVEALKVLLATALYFFQNLLILTDLILNLAVWVCLSTCALLALMPIVIIWIHYWF